MGKVSFPLKSALERDGDFYQRPPHPKSFTEWAIGPSRKTESRGLGLLGSQY